MSITQPNDDRWYCRLLGEEFGPLPFELLCDMADNQQVGADDLVRLGGSGAWQVARAIPELRQILERTNTAQMLPTTAATPIADSVNDTDQWYYKLDDRTHGPLVLAELLELVGGSGETASDVSVRHGPLDAWVPFSSLPGIQVARGSVSSDKAERSPVVPTATFHINAAVTKFQTTLRRNRDVAITVVLWLGLNSLVFAVWPRPYTTERNYFVVIRGLEAQVNSLRATHASTQEWEVLRTSVKQAIEPIVSDLRTSASASKPVRQRLLWAARDQLPRLVGPASTEVKEAEQLYKSHMRFIEQELGDH